MRVTNFNIEQWNFELNKRMMTWRKYGFEIRSEIH